MQSAPLVGEVEGRYRPSSVLNHTVQCIPTKGSDFGSCTYGCKTLFSVSRIACQICVAFAFMLY